MGLGIPDFVCVWSDIPRPDNEVIQKKSEHEFFARLLPKKSHAGGIFSVVKIDE